ncbi:hypothetical protein MMC17_001782 [Xylographa soralifera]|nr:hypothetical protein [Xylographa soralifera]
MIDPIVVFSAIATSLSVLNLAITAAVKLRTSYVEFREAGDRLTHLRLQLQGLETALKVWKQCWIIPGATEYSYTTAWGSEGLAVIEEILEEIGKLTRRIWGILQSSSYRVAKENNRTEECPTLHTWVASIGEGGDENALDALPLRLKKKCLFVLFSNDELKEKITRLKDQVGLLESQSRHWWCLQHTGTGEAPSEEERDRVLKLNHIRDFMSEWHELCIAEDQGNWTLDLDLPNIPATEFDIWDVIDVATINFTVVDGDILVARQYKSGRVRICLRKKEQYRLMPVSLQEALLAVFNDTENDGTYTRFADSLIEISWLEPPGIYKRLTRSLEERLLQGSRLNENEQSTFLFERACLAFGTAIWTLLLWSTPWLSRLCSCAIHCVHIAEHKPVNLLESAGRMGCVKCQTSNDRMLLFGVLLAELALGETVIICPNTNDTNQFVIDEQAFNERKLLKRLEDGKMSNGYVNAVRFCLNHSTRVSGCDLDIRVIKEYTREILRPYDMHCLVVTVAYTQTRVKDYHRRTLQRNSRERTRRVLGLEH